MFATREELLETIEKIKEEDILILVEGKKDKNALEQFEIKNSIVLNGKDIWNRLEEIATQKKEVLILTDFDQKGKELYGKICKNLDKLGIKVNKRYREFFQKKTKLSHIEGLTTYVENLELSKKT